MAKEDKQYAALIKALEQIRETETQELVITRKGSRKIFKTILLGNIAFWALEAAANGVYTWALKESEKKNGPLWRFMQSSPKNGEVDESV